MTNAQHTPGPWFTKEGAIYAENGNTLARVPNTLGDEQDAANARLIAAAPELLEALENLMGVCEVLCGGPNKVKHQHYDEARAAIGKAKGE